MSRISRPRYPSDNINYHKQRRPDVVQSIRIPEDRLIYYQLKHALNATHANTVRFIFDAADTAINEVMTRQERHLPEFALRAMDQQLEESNTFEGEDFCMDEEMDSEPNIEVLDEETLAEFGLECVDDEDEEPEVPIEQMGVVLDSQAPMATQLVPLPTIDMGRPAQI